MVRLVSPRPAVPQISSASRKNKERELCSETGDKGRVVRVVILCSEERV